MKKFLAILSLVCFIGVTSRAEDPKSTSAEKTPAACCAHSSKACCKNNTAAKACTPEQKAECAKAGAMKSCEHGDKAKAESKDEKSEAKK